MAEPSTVECSGCFEPKDVESRVCPRCGYDPEALRSPSLLPVQARLSRYTIGEKLGRGRFGITYRGFDVKLRVKVAIKEYYPSAFVKRAGDRITLELIGSENEALFEYGLKAFAGEAHVLAELQHPNLVRVFDLFKMNGTAYLVMDYYKGETLHDYLARQPNRKLPWRRAVSLLLPVLDGLHEVHRNGFLHRDVNPDNLCLTRRDELILLDFSAARQAISDRAHGLAVYSNGFAAYEQSMQSELGPWTDVYGAAATLYLLLTGHVPPPATERKQRDLKKSAWYFNSGLPADLDKTLTHALAVEPGKRLQSVEDFKEQLQAILERGKNKSAKPTPAPRSLGKKPRRRALVGSLSLAALVIGLVTAWPFSGLDGFTQPSLSSKVAPDDPTVPSSARAPVRSAVDPVPKNATLEPSTPDHQPKQTQREASVEAPEVSSGSASHVFHDKLHDRSDGPAMVVISPGEFWMGSPENEKGREENERRHLVKIEKRFAIGQFEVTFDEYDRFCAAKDCERSSDAGWGRGRRPAINISWGDAVAYAQWLSEQTGQRYRLPTEAEWEYAARAGSQTVRYWGNGPTQACQYANVLDQSVKEVFPGGDIHNCTDKFIYTAPVGSFRPNAWNVSDMLGNVWEWTCSLYDKDYGGAERECADNNAEGARAARGGSWLYEATRVRSAARFGMPPASNTSSAGFRVVRAF